MPNIAITIASGMVIGFYDGFFGPGIGSFFVFIMVRFLRFDFVTGTGNAKAMNLGSNIGSLATFILGGLVIWPLGDPDGHLQRRGKFLGARWRSRTGLEVCAVGVPARGGRDRGADDVVCCHQ